MFKTHYYTEVMRKRGHVLRNKANLVIFVLKLKWSQPDLALTMPP